MMNGDESSIFSHHLSPPARPQQSSDSMRPISPQSLNSSSISRSNTFNTVSSSGTLKSREFSPDPSKNGYQSPRRVLSQKSQRTFDSLDKEQSQISTANSSLNSSIHHNSNINNNNNSNNTNSMIINSSNNKNDWMMMSDVCVFIVIIVYKNFIDFCYSISRFLTATQLPIATQILLLYIP